MFKLYKLGTKKAKTFAISALIFVALQGIFEGLQASMLAGVISAMPTDTTPVNASLY